MAHEIWENDEMFYVGEKPWHGLGVKVDEAPNSEDALRIAKLDWTINPTPIYCGGRIVEGTYGNVRSDTQECLGIVTDKYKVCQNTEAFAFTDALIGDGKVRYETAGSLYNGKKVWMLARLEDRKILGDDYVNYICFSNSHDGKSSIQVCTSNIRVVCSNTLQLCIKNAPRSWSVRHFSTLEGRLEEARKALDFSEQYMLALDKKANELVSLKVDNVEKLIFELVKIDSNAGKRVVENNERIRETILDLYTNKPDLQNFRGTAWGLYQAVADYTSNAKALRNAPTYNERKFEKQFITNETMLIDCQKIIESMVA